jgi:cysteine desulfurase
LERLGLRIELVPVDRRARMNMDAYESLLGGDVLLACLIHANNEIGTIQPVGEAAALAKRAGALVFVDAVQTFPAARLDVWPEVDMISASSHKIHGPAGAGLLAVRSGTPLRAIIRGGGQEREMRAGTENVAAIVGFAAAAGTASAQDAASKAAARDSFLAELEAKMAGRFEVTAQGADVLPGHAHLRIPGRKADGLLITLDAMGIAASSGAACSSGALEPSHVLLACGFSIDEAEEGLRFTFGRASTLDGAVRAAEALARIGRGPEPG